jgi:DNA topoisomerase-1
VEKQGKALHPTDTGDVVSSFLEQHFSSYISDTFTAEMEQELDEIASGKRKYEKTLRDFYAPFQKDIKAKDKIEKVTTLRDADPTMRCPVCDGPMIEKLGKSGIFLSCKKFPECQGARTKEGAAMEGPKPIGEPCPRCGGELVERQGRFGQFIACGNYPKCKYTRSDEKSIVSSGVKCNVCNKGDMIERRGRFGIFWSCSNYPECKHAIKAKPTGRLCTECGALMMEGTKTIPERCSRKECPHHNPHKVKVS